MCCYYRFTITSRIHDLIIMQISDILFCGHCCRFARVGSMVLALHDASDVFLEVGKMSKYSGAEALASCSFVMFVLLWILLRLIYYPFWILWSTRSVCLLIKPLLTLVICMYYDDGLFLSLLSPDFCILMLLSSLFLFVILWQL